MMGKKAHSQSTIKVPQKIRNRAGLLIDQVLKTDVFKFIKLFDLGDNFDELYYKKLVDTLFEAQAITEAANVLIDCKLYRHYDLLSILKLLGQKGKKNREYAIEILKVNKQFIDDVVKFFSTEDTYFFASDVVREFNLQQSSFKEL
jgi:hypothetical protein